MSAIAADPFVFGGNPGYRHGAILTRRTGHGPVLLELCALDGVAWEHRHVVRRLGGLVRWSAVLAVAVAVTVTTGGCGTVTAGSGGPGGSGGSSRAAVSPRVP